MHYNISCSFQLITLPSSMLFCLLQLLERMVTNLRLANKPLYQVQIDLHLQFPHGIMEDKNQIKMALEICGRGHATTAEILTMTRYLQIVVENNILTKKITNIRTSGQKNLKYPEWKDLFLILTHVSGQFKPPT